MSLEHEDDVLWMVNMDETHHDGSTEGDKGGSRAQRWANASYHRSGDRIVKNTRHTTGVYATNPLEPLPPLYIFDTSAKHTANQQIDPLWCRNLPEVQGKFGLGVVTKFGSKVAVRKKGSMDSSLFIMYFDEIFLPCYPHVQKETVRCPITKKKLAGPVLMKVDAGPGRLSKEAESLEFRHEMEEKGVYIMLGLPNGTEATQEMDQCYADFKPACARSTERLAGIKLAARVRARKVANGGTVTANSMTEDLAAYLDAHQDEEDNENGDKFTFSIKQNVCNVSITNRDLSFIVNGLPNDPIEKKPFSNTFTRSNIWSWWNKVGFIPMNRNAVNDPKVRYERGEGGAPEQESKMIELLVEDYAKCAADLAGMGFNEDILDLEAATVEPKNYLTAENEEELVDKIIASKAIGKAGGMFKTGMLIANAPIIVMAEKKMAALEKAGMEEKEKNATHAEKKKTWDGAAAYEKWVLGGRKKDSESKPILSPDDAKHILKFLLPIIAPTEKLSSYNSGKKSLQRLMEIAGGTTWEAEMEQQVVDLGYRRLF